MTGGGSEFHVGGGATLFSLGARGTMVGSDLTGGTTDW